MKSKITLLAAAFLCLIRVSFADEFYGTYTTKPEIVPGFYAPYSDKELKLIERLTWRMTITENEISILMGGEDNKFLMSYIVEGKYLLAKEIDSEAIKYFPFYIENVDTVHGFGTVFFRTK